MSKKITISVPDELHDKMKEWKASFNFSQVFQTAMINMIRKKEAFQKKISDELDISAIIKRLKEEKFEFENNFLEDGKKDGFEWCKTAHYSELQYVLAVNSTENLFNDEKYAVYFNTVLERYKKMVAVSGQIAQSRFNEFTTKYVDGWKEGVESFWNEVKDRL